MKLNLNLLKQAAAIAKPYWSSKEGRRSYWLVAVLILLLLADTQLNVWFNAQVGRIHFGPGRSRGNPLLALGPHLPVVAAGRRA